MDSPLMAPDIFNGMYFRLGYEKARRQAVCEQLEARFGFLHDAVFAFVDSMPMDVLDVFEKRVESATSLDDLDLGYNGGFTWGYRLGLTQAYRKIYQKALEDRYGPLRGGMLNVFELSALRKRLIAAMALGEADREGPFCDLPIVRTSNPTVH